MILNLLTLSLNSDLAIIQFFAFDYSPFLTFLVVFTWTNLSVVITFCLAGLLNKKVIEKKGWRTKFANLKWVRRTQRAMKRGRKKFLAWLLKQEKIIILLVLLIPGVPVVKGVAIVVARMSGLKNILALMLITNTLRVLVIIFFVYSI